jgi:adenine-specific DNA-methyltransferase
VEVFARNRAAAEADPDMFRDRKSGCSDILELEEVMGKEYHTLKEINAAIAELMKEHRQSFDEQLKQRGVNLKEGRKNDPWNGIYLYCNAEYRDANGQLVSEANAKQVGATIWIWREVDPSMPSGKQSASTRDPSSDNYRYYKPRNPETGAPCPHPKRGWAFPEKAIGNRPSFESYVDENRIVFKDNEESTPQLKYFLHQVADIVSKSVIRQYADGEKHLDMIFGQKGIFPNPKPPALIERFVTQTCGSHDFVMDFFGGSGTTGQAVIEANRQEALKRKYLLIEVGDYFDTVMIYSKDWKDGKPVSRQGSSHAFKYIRLESYEDALDNISFESADAQAMFQMEDYVLSYMLDFETKQSETLLNVAKLDAPFDYRLKRHGKDEPQPVDLPETFNYLIGLHVASRRVFENKGTRYLVYRGKADGRETAILWRTTHGWKKEQFEADRDFVAKQKLTEGAEDIFVNTDSFIEGARSLDPVFKKKMFNED